MSPSPAATFVVAVSPQTKSLTLGVVRRRLSSSEFLLRPEMDAAVVLQPSSSTYRTSNFYTIPSFSGACQSSSLSFNANLLLSGGCIKIPSTSSKLIVSTHRRYARIRASSADSTAPIAPLQLESPIGQFLSQILVSHPHLLPAAVDQQLEQLHTDREAEKQKEETSTCGTDLVLYRRIAEVKANERKEALEEILYALIVQKFVDANVSLVPALSQPADPSGRIDTWPAQEEKLVQLHSPEAYEMIQNHLTFILGNRLDESNSVAQTSKLRVGQVYAASVMYGYFLKRVDQRFQLEKTMRTLPYVSDEGIGVEQVVGDDSRPNARVRIEELHPQNSGLPNGFSPEGFGEKMKSTRLRSYVMSFDAETLQRYATIRSKEAIGIIEKHTEALFGRPEIVSTPQGTVGSSKHEVIKISFGGLKRLVLEAVTFGSFLWDVESYVDSRYHFVLN